MLSLLLVCVGWLGGEPSAEDLATYQKARAEAGRTAEAQVKLALWCEAHGMTAERLQHLTMAVLAEPMNPVARGLLGLVHEGDGWKKPSDLAKKVQEDAALSATLAEYADKRAKAPNTAEAQWHLALWCEEHGLKVEAIAHLTAVIRHDPSREGAWKKLGYKKVGKHWVTDAQISAARAESEAQKKANAHWKLKLEKIRGELHSAKKKDQARAELAEVTDARALPMVWRVLSPNDPKPLVQVLGQIPTPATSRLLAMIAVQANDAEVRQLASETLLRRDPREFADVLVAMIRPKIRYKVKQVGGPGSPGTLLIEGKDANLQRVYAPPSGPIVTAGPRDFWDVDDQGMPVLVKYAGSMSTPRQNPTAMRQALQADMNTKTPAPSGTTPGGAAALAELDRLRAQNDAANIAQIDNFSDFAGRKMAPGWVEYQTDQFVRIPIGQMQAQANVTAAMAEKQLERDVASIDDYNTSVTASNIRVTDLLKPFSREDYGDDVDAWNHWATDLRGYALTTPAQTTTPPTFVENVPLDFQPSPLQTQLVNGGTRQTVGHSCFAAGTLVKTRLGDKPIETLCAGDVLLTRDTTSGGLSFHPVLAVFHNPPAETLRVSLDSSAVVATGIHRFWRVGKGWTMARDLKPGDLVRLVGRTAKVQSVSTDKVQPVFNLEIAGAHSFFVGESGVLVHDNSLIVPMSEPFDSADLARVSKPN